MKMIFSLVTGVALALSMSLVAVPAVLERSVK